MDPLEEYDTSQLATGAATSATSTTSSSKPDLKTLLNVDALGAPETQAIIFYALAGAKVSYSHASRQYRQQDLAAVAARCGQVPGSSHWTWIHAVGRAAIAHSLSLLQDSPDTSITCPESEVSPAIESNLAMIRTILGSAPADQLHAADRKEYSLLCNLWSNADASGGSDDSLLVLASCHTNRFVREAAAGLIASLAAPSSPPAAAAAGRPASPPIGAATDGTLSGEGRGSRPGSPPVAASPASGPGPSLQHVACAALAVPSSGATAPTDKQEHAINGWRAVAQVLGHLMRDNWSQVRFAAVEACGAFMQLAFGAAHAGSAAPGGLCGEPLKGVLDIVLPPLILNRYFSASGVSAAANYRWRSMHELGLESIQEVEARAVATGEFLVAEAQSSPNHAVRGAAALVLAELGSKLSEATRLAVAPAGLKVLLHLLDDTVATVRRSAAVAVQRLLVGSPFALSGCSEEEEEEGGSAGAEHGGGDGASAIDGGKEEDKKDLSGIRNTAIRTLAVACTDHVADVATESGRALGIACRMLGWEAREQLAAWLEREIDATRRQVQSGTGIAASSGAGNDPSSSAAGSLAEAGVDYDSDGADNLHSHALPPELRAGGSDQQSSGGVSKAQLLRLPRVRLDAVRAPSVASCGPSGVQGTDPAATSAATSAASESESESPATPAIQRRTDPCWSLLAGIAACDELAAAEGSPGAMPPAAKKSRFGGGGSGTGAARSGAVRKPMGDADEEAPRGPAESVLAQLLRASASEGHPSIARARRAVLEELAPPCEKLGKSATKRILARAENALVTLVREASGDPLDPDTAAARVAGRECLRGLQRIIGPRVTIGRLGEELREQATRLGWLGGDGGGVTSGSPGIRVVRSPVGAIGAGEGSGTSGAAPASAGPGAGAPGADALAARLRSLRRGGGATAPGRKGEGGAFGRVGAGGASRAGVGLGGGSSSSGGGAGIRLPRSSELQTFDARKPYGGVRDERWALAPTASIAEEGQLPGRDGAAISPPVGASSSAGRDGDPQRKDIEVRALEPGERPPQSALRFVSEHGSLPPEDGGNVARVSTPRPGSPA